MTEKQFNNINIPLFPYQIKKYFRDSKYFISIHLKYVNVQINIFYHKILKTIDICRVDLNMSDCKEKNIEIANNIKNKDDIINVIKKILIEYNLLKELKI